MSAVLRQRLAWIDQMRSGLLFALGEDVMHHTVEISPTVDPLKVILRIPLLRPMATGTRAPVRVYIRCWAHRNNCEMPAIDIDDKRIQAEIFIKHRHWKPDVAEE